ncbi:MAG: hypothetical protein L3J33_03265 [Rhodobacteraceae bacterium]|nr:hypothetical protein [Paracoccaceae bacterium]
MNLDFDTRTQLVFSLMASKTEGILTRYQRPDHLSDTAARGVINDMVADINAKIPAGEKDDFMAILERFKVNLRQITTSRQWPSTPIILRAITHAIDDAPKPMFEAVDLSPEAINGARIRNGEAVGEYWISPEGADRLLQAGLITDADLAGYFAGGKPSE